MRLTTYEINAIKQTHKNVFKQGDIYLFGSRVDDDKRGGDIDLYVITTQTTTPLQERKLKQKFKLALYNKIGEQKIDIIISKDKNRSIENEAIKTEVKL
jgi:predicted nucleotidyltransferase